MNTLILGASLFNRDDERFMWFNPGAAQKHFQMSFSGSESQKVNDNSSTLTAPNLNANAAAGSTRSLLLCVLQ